MKVYMNMCLWIWVTTVSVFVPQFPDGFRRSGSSSLAGVDGGVAVEGEGRHGHGGRESGAADKLLVALGEGAVGVVRLVILVALHLPQCRGNENMNVNKTKWQKHL